MGPVHHGRWGSKSGCSNINKLRKDEEEASKLVSHTIQGAALPTKPSSDVMPKNWVVKMSLE